MVMFLSSTHTPTLIPTSFHRNSFLPLLMSMNSSSSSSVLHFDLRRPVLSNKMGSKIKCELSSSSSSASPKKLEIGSPIIIVEAPKVLKTAATMPCLRPNSGLVKAGDVGRIVSRKPKDVWAVRLTSGTYLVDGKYFKPLVLDDNN